MLGHARVVTVQAVPDAGLGEACRERRQHQVDDVQQVAQVEVDVLADVVVRAVNVEPESADCCDARTRPEADLHVRSQHGVDRRFRRQVFHFRPGEINNKGNGAVWLADEIGLLNVTR